MDNFPSFLQFTILTIRDALVFIGRLLSAASASSDLKQKADGLKRWIEQQPIDKR